MIEISKELLSEVFGVNIDENDIYIKNNYTYYSYCRCDNEWINASSNIYEFAHKCKEWALSKGYYLHSHIKEDNECWCIVKSLDNITRQFSCEMDTESEAIIKACQWILKEIKK